MTFPEHFSFESPQAGAEPPRIGQETRFTAGLRGELLRRPAVLHRYLRQQQPAMAAVLDDEAMPADADILGASDRFEAAQDGDFDHELG